MNITVIGCGNAGTTIAADLSLKGHNVTLCKSSSSKLHNEHYNSIYKSQSVDIIKNGSKHNAALTVTSDLEKAVSGSQVIIIYIQTNYHEDLIRRISPFLSDGQTVIIEPGYLSTCYLLKYTSKNITVIEAESSPIDCRIVEPGVVKVLFENVLNPFGVYPKRNKSKAEYVLNELKYPYCFTESVIESALHNPNLIVHTVGSIFSIPRIEYVQKNGGEFSMYREIFTPHIWNLVLSLDNEKMNVLEKLSLKRKPYVEACKERNSNDKDIDPTETFFDYAYNSSPDGPYTPDSRYITEDVSQGLVLLESLGKVLSVNTPITTSLINISCSIFNIDFRKNGRTVDSLGRDIIERIINDERKV